MLLDTGDVLSGAGEYAALKARFYEKAIPYLRYDAIGVGEMEARYIRECSVQEPFSKAVPTVSANIINPTDGKPIVREPYVIKKTKNGLKVGIISTLGETLLDSFMQEKLGIRPTSVKEALTRHMGKLRDQSDLVILMYHGDIQTAKTLATDFPDIDVILNGHANDQTPDEVQVVGRTLIMATKAAGKYVGRMVLDIGADRKIIGHSGEYVPMAESYQDDAEMAKLVVQNDKDIEDYYARMRMQYARYTNDPSQPRTPKPFVTANHCRNCHAQEYESWNHTGHARAFNALRKGDKTRDPECVSCHTTGYKLKGGFTSEETTPDLTQVQCEMCHGPGVIHARRPGKGYGVISKTTCTQCHDRANSPKFDYDVYRVQVLHKKADGAGAEVTPTSK